MIGLLALSIGCDPPPTEGCRSAADCEGAQVCIDGTCTAAPDAPSVDAPADTTCTCAPGASCASGVCAMDCGDPLATPCASGDECDFATGACVAEGTAGALTGDGVTCGSARCMPGSECGLGDVCIAAPPCASMRCNADRSVCWGSVCTSTRPVASCTPASIERMSMPDFLRGGDNGLVDLELDDACNVYGVTTISGTDYLRELAPDGTLTEHPGVTNLNMGEVAVLRPFSSEFEESPGEVALTYTCCLTCGCVGSDPQGVARLDREGSVRLPMVLTAVASDATGPFGVQVECLQPHDVRAVPSACRCWTVVRTA